MPSARTSVAIARSLLALTAAASVLTPTRSVAQDEGPAEDRDQQRQNSAQVDVDIDILQVGSTEVEEALGDIADNVEQQQQQLTAAETALVEAENALAAADLALAETQQRLDNLSLQTDRVVIDAFMNPPTENALDALTAESLTDMAVKQSILDTQATSDADTLTMYEEASEQLEIQQAEREQLAAAAEENRAAAETALADLTSALSQQALFAVEVESRLDRQLGEAESLARQDPAMAQQIEAREAALAGTLSEIQSIARSEQAQETARELAAAAEAAKGYGTIKHPPGGVVTVTCSSGETIEVAGDISGPVGRLLEDSAAAGLSMCGWGFRDPQDQINLRRQNCGSSSYAIYQAPSSACSPPTARPGTSMHEQGLAIDFTCSGDSVNYGDPCHDFLEANAVNYGLYNLPGEPWHWSVDGN